LTPVAISRVRVNLDVRDRFTPAEARQLASALLNAGDRAERP